MTLLGQAIGNYRVVSLLGKGAMGVVYLAEHFHLGRRVAIKTLLPALAADEVMVSRFFAEARAVTAIGHPNIVEVLDLGQTPDPDGGQTISYYIMEYLEGETLRARLQRGLSLGDALDVVRQCCGALAASHRVGIVHRDLKPENIFLVDREGSDHSVKLLDFGIARLLGHAPLTVLHRTRAGSLLGTPAYMSPEQATGKPVDARSDVYSLGVVLYQALTGRLPFEASRLEALIAAHVSRHPAPPSTLSPSVPPAIDGVVLHALAKEPDARFQSMDDFARALERPADHHARWQAPVHTDDDPFGSLLPLVQSLETIPARDAATPDLQSSLAQTLAARRPEVPKAPVPAETTPPTPVARGPMEPLDLGRLPALSLELPGQAPRAADRSPGPARKPPPPRPASATEKQPQDRKPGPSRAVRAGLLVGFIVALAAVIAIGARIGGSTANSARNGERSSSQSTITIESIPDGATVYRSGRPQPLGQTPIQLWLTRTEPRFDVKLQLPGHEYEVREIDPRQDANITVRLKPDGR